MTAAGGGRIAGVEISHPERLVYPGAGITKAELAAYYAAVADRILPHVAGRPLAVVRCPEGIARDCFYQKHVASLARVLPGVEIEEKGGERERYLMVEGVADLVTLVQHGAVELHPWASRADRLERPDRLIFDLDPGEGAGWPRVVEAAREVGAALRELDLTPFLRTTGGKGLHVVVPLVRRQGWEELHGFAAALARRLAAARPERYTTSTAKEHRRGKVFLDYLRNTRGATAVASYSTRARPGAPVATPLDWQELEALAGSDRWTVRSVGPRVATGAADPWRGFFERRQRLTAARLRAVGAGG